MSTTKLKIFAAALMFIDHCNLYIPGTPNFFRIIGRLSLPIFVFCIAVGMENSKNRKKYILRLYLMGIIMSIINLALSAIFINKTVVHNPENNIFILLCTTAIMINIFQESRNTFEIIKRILFYFIYMTGTLALFHFISLSSTIEHIGSSILLSPYSAEFEFKFVILGVLFYFFQKDKKRMSISFILFCLLDFIVFKYEIVYRIFARLDYFSYYKFNYLLDISSKILGYGYRYLDNTYQWMMIGALSVLLCYNGLKGNGYKRFFYLFYPLHIIGLFLLGNFLSCR